jgi:hypothetical protein
MYCSMYKLPAFYVVAEYSLIRGMSHLDSRFYTYCTIDISKISNRCLIRPHSHIIRLGVATVTGKSGTQFDEFNTVELTVKSDMHVPKEQRSVEYS